MDKGIEAIPAMRAKPGPDRPGGALFGRSGQFAWSTVTRLAGLLVTLLAMAAPAMADPSVTAARIGAHPDKTRFVMELSEMPSYEIFTLPDPFRVVIDLPQLVWRLPANQVPRGVGTIEDLRFGLFAPGRSRVVLDVREPVRVSGVRVLPPNTTVKGYRLVIDLHPISRQAFFAQDRQPIGSKRPLPAARPSELANLQATSKDDERPMIVIDAGHGGVDPGAVGVSGAFEKDIVLGYARELQRKLLATGRYRVALTRNSDVVLPLRRRTALAERAKADLFISLHANIHASRKVRGASVYTISKKSSDAEAEALAAKENKADILAGVNLEGQTDDVTIILLDLARRETDNLSKRFANIMVTQLGTVTRLLRNTHRSAGFAVLKSPTVPSVLVEIGYMSNRQEEKLLRSRSYRSKASETLLKAIDNYFEWHERMSRS